MKNKFLVILLVSAPILAGCYEDHSSTAFEDGEIITVEGIEPYYFVTAHTDLLRIKPNVTSNKEADWDYSWAIYESGSKSSFPTLDTLCHTKELEMIFYRAPKPWILTFSAKNKLTGYQTIVTTNLYLNTLFTAGWIILKDDGVETDVDIFPITNSIYADNPKMLPESPIPLENIISESNDGRKMKGTGIKLNLTDSWEIFDPGVGTFEHTRVYVFVSSDDFFVTLTSDMSIVRDPSNLSYDTWASVKPDFFYEGPTRSLVAGFGGKVYSITTMSNTSGRFGIHKLLDASNPDYCVSKNLCVVNPDGGILFDDLSSSFIYVNYHGDISYIQKTAASAVETQRNNLRCLYMGTFMSSNYGVFEDKTTGQRKILSFNSVPPLNVQEQAVLTDEDKASKASMYTMVCDEQVMYFVAEDGNVYSRVTSMGGKTENLEFVTPQDETVTFIRHHMVLYSIGPPPLMASQIAIATSKGSGASATYHIRFFSKSAGRMGQLVMELQGNGYARDYMNVFNNSVTAYNCFFYNRYL